jgi:hypothetical protein
MLPPGPADYEKLLNQTVQKSAVGVGGIDTGTWGSALAPFQESSAGFVQSLAPFSAFDRLMADGAFTRAPLRTRVVFASSASIGSTASEGTPKPLGALSFSYENLQAHKAIAEVVFTDELALSMSPASTSRIQTDLAKEVAKATDENSRNCQPIHRRCFQSKYWTNRSAIRDPPSTYSRRKYILQRRKIA